MIKYSQGVVFEANTEGYQTFRIPAIIRNSNGDLLAFAEGRVNGGADFGHIHIVLKKSKDNGQTWSPLQCVATNGVFQAGNPAPVVDTTDPNYPEGRIFLFYNTGDVDEMGLREGKSIRRVWFVTSIDGGNDWSQPIEITTQVHRLNAPELHQEWVHTEDWRTYANTPGHAFQFTHGVYRGRIYVAANHSAGIPLMSDELYKAKGFYTDDHQPVMTRFLDMDYQAHGYFTDDHGQSFQLSESVPFKGSNESSACQIGKQSLMMNSRNQLGNYRVVSLSADGGQTWQHTFEDKNLPDPICQGAILNVAFDENTQQDTLAFVNLADTKRRANLTLRISKDSGKTWPCQYVLTSPESIERDAAGYSDLVKLNDKEIGILYEADTYQRIVFVTVRWKN